MSHSKNISPVGWYVASYMLRFVELDKNGNDDPKKRFLTWENTVLVRAESLDEAYDKTVAIGALSSVPYKGGPNGVDVQWLFEGVTDILPVYEELEDDCEILWAERTFTLANIRKSVRRKGEFGQ